MALSSATELRGTARLLDLDPDLGQLLDGERLQAAERELVVRVTTFEIGEWHSERLSDADPVHLGLLLLEGVLAREVVLGDTVSTELLGAGDIIRPWQLHGPPELLPIEVRWNALSAVRLAVLDRRAAAVVARYPELNAVIVDRLVERAVRLAINQAISQVNRVDRRLLALFWHLAERWGRVAREGIAIPLVLSHRLIGELIGARRPTVSTALTDLARSGQLIRREDGTWLLTGEPVNVPAPSAAEVIRQRRRLMPTAAEPVADPGQELAPATSTRMEVLRDSLEAARNQSQTQRETLGALQAQTRALRQRSSELRAQRLQHLDALRDAAVERGRQRA